MRNLSRSSILLRFALLVVFFVVIVALTLVASSGVSNRTLQPANGAAAIVQTSGEGTTQGTPVDPPRPLTDFTLTGTDGEPVSLSDLQGDYVLLAFGYTHCPDYCPTTLAEFKQVKNELGAEAENVSFVFVSVDGERDTPEFLGEYMERFDPAFVGMTTEDETALETMGEQFGMFYERHNEGAADEDYAVDHTVTRYLIDPDGSLIMTYSFSVDPSVITADLQERL